MIFSEYINEMATTQPRRKIQKDKPRLIVEYNTQKGSIDHSDLMLSYYSCTRTYNKVI